MYCVFVLFLCNEAINANGLYFSLKGFLFMSLSCTPLGTILLDLKTSLIASITETKMSEICPCFGLYFMYINPKSSNIRLDK